ncbi:hypothetical protein VNO77_44738 [Canavalia gladiata]|uniref:Uncharacterized protein n=1 Tax=Canavalia gladiata TaxID=3824 RepID=A0AAN9JYZ7_CANGL
MKCLATDIDYHPGLAGMLILASSFQGRVNAMGFGSNFALNFWNSKIQEPQDSYAKPSEFKDLLSQKPSRKNLCDFDKPGLHCGTQDSNFVHHNFTLLQSKFLGTPYMNQMPL